MLEQYITTRKFDKQKWVKIVCSKSCVCYSCKDLTPVSLLILENFKRAYSILLKTHYLLVCHFTVRLDPSPHLVSSRYKLDSRNLTCVFKCHSVSLLQFNWIFFVQVSIMAQLKNENQCTLYSMLTERLSSTSITFKYGLMSGGYYPCWLLEVPYLYHL